MKQGEIILGVEGGGTKTAWVLAERDGEELRIVEQGKLPPANFRLTTPERLRAIFRAGRSPMARKPTRSRSEQHPLAHLACPNEDCSAFNRFDAGNLSVVERIGAHVAADPL